MAGEARFRGRRVAGLSTGVPFLFFALALPLLLSCSPFPSLSLLSCPPFPSLSLLSCSPFLALSLLSSLPTIFHGVLSPSPFFQPTFRSLFLSSLLFSPFIPSPHSPRGSSCSLRRGQSILHGEETASAVKPPIQHTPNCTRRRFNADPSGASRLFVHLTGILG